MKKKIPLHMIVHLDLHNLITLHPVHLIVVFSLRRETCKHRNAHDQTMLTKTLGTYRLVEAFSARLNQPW